MYSSEPKLYELQPQVLTPTEVPYRKVNYPITPKQSTSKIKMTKQPAPQKKIKTKRPSL